MAKAKWAELSLLPEQRELHILIRSTEEWFYIPLGPEKKVKWILEKREKGGGGARWHGNGRNSMKRNRYHLAGSFISNGYTELRIN